jgi:F-type H+-transporting ATPase subunit a
MSSSFIFFFIGLIPIILLFGIIGLELAIAIIQAYVFSVLTISYLKDAILSH